MVGRQEGRQLQHLSVDVLLSQLVLTKGTTDNVYRNHHRRHRSHRRLHLDGSCPRRGQPAAAAAAQVAPRSAAAFASVPCCTARAARVGQGVRPWQSLRGVLPQEGRHGAALRALPRGLREEDQEQHPDRWHRHLWCHSPLLPRREGDGGGSEAGWLHSRSGSGRKRGGAVQPFADESHLQPRQEDQHPQDG